VERLRTSAKEQQEQDGNDGKLRICRRKSTHGKQTKAPIEAAGHHCAMDTFGAGVRSRE
jgi:hypothetical protein